MDEALLACIAELQTTRDELVAANEELIAAHGDIRAMATRAFLGQPNSSPAGHGETGDVKNKFMRFVSDVTDKKDWKAEVDLLRAQVEALGKGNESALNA